MAGGCGAGLGGALNDNCVCVAARFITSPPCHPLKRILLCLPQFFFFPQDCLVCPHGSWAFCGVEVGKTDGANRTEEMGREGQGVLLFVLCLLCEVNSGTGRRGREIKAQSRDSMNSVGKSGERPEWRGRQQSLGVGVQFASWRHSL